MSQPTDARPHGLPEILGNYVENGTNNSRASYEGPNGYWLYHAVMTDGFGGTIGDAWVVGKPKGSTNINGADIRHYKLSSTATPPLNTKLHLFIQRMRNRQGADRYSTTPVSTDPV